MTTPFHPIFNPLPSPTGVTMAMTKCISYACMSLCSFCAQGWAAGRGGERARHRNVFYLKC